MTREEKKREEVPKRRKKKERRGKILARGEAKGRWNDGVMVGCPDAKCEVTGKEKKSREEKNGRSEEKEADKREETRSKRSKSRILTLLKGK